MNSDDILKCPVCGDNIKNNGSSYTCKNNHTFDISNKKYVNLLMPNKKSSLNPGDSKEMVNARTEFLNLEFYSLLSEKINEIALKEIKEVVDKKEEKNIVLLDSGCGEGYYSSRLENLLEESDIENCVFGIDISKEAIKKASQRNKNIYFLVGSSFELPVFSNSIDGIIQIFSPFSEMEFKRVLSENGFFISVSPNENHLKQLKALLYDSPKHLVDEKSNFSSFELKYKENINYKIKLESSEMIKNLLLMTPFTWHSSVAKKEEIMKMENLELTLDFVISVYSCKKFKGDENK